LENNLYDDPTIAHVQSFLADWYASLENVPAAQDAKMLELLGIYEETELGQRNGAESIEDYNQFQAFIPVSDYQSLTPYFNSVFSGDFQIMMADPPLAWALSRDRTKGIQRLYPMTEYDLRVRVRAWPRAIFNYINRTGKFDLLSRETINISYPANVQYLMMGRTRLPSGYQSGLVIRFGGEHLGLKLIPDQDQIDKLPVDLGKRSWKKRFRVILEAGKSKDIGIIRGDVRVVLQFGQYLKSQFGKTPKQLWNPSLICCYGTTGIHAKYKLPLRQLFGDCTILETFESGEGSFAQQIDESPYLVPNYDLYFFESQSNGIVKPLYMMQAGESGHLIVSSSVLPRLRVGVQLRCMAPNKFVVVGSTKGLGKLKYDMFTSGSELSTQKDIW
jgi:hypothetical protein